MAVPSSAQIGEAQRLLAPHLPVTRLAPVADHPGLHLKLELELPTRSFKVRGALYALTRRLQRGPVAEVIASSTGNHGAAVAWAAQRLGVPATIFLPAHPNPVKRKNITDLGARVVEVTADDISGAAVEADAYAFRRPGVYYLNDATDTDVPAATGVIGLEITDQLPGVACIYVPMGDTALIRGVAAAVKAAHPNVRIIGVQAERSPCYYLSWKAGRPIATDTCDTCADGLATRTPQEENVAAIRTLVDDVLLVSEDQMLAAVRLLYERAGVLAEPSGAAATAAWLQHPPSGPAVALVTGANIAPAIRLRAGL
ncbi:MAG: threonine ammonia-lyase [Terriglobales bacterium]